MRREFPRKVKAAASMRAAGSCERCKAILKAGEAEYDHVLPCELGGEPTLANCQVICKQCHRGPNGKTAEDIGRIRKADRARDKATGAIRPRGTIPQRPTPAREVRPSLPPRPLFITWPRVHDDRGD